MVPNPPLRASPLNFGSTGQVLAVRTAPFTSPYSPLLHGTEKSQLQPGKIHRRTSVLLEDSRHEHKIK